MKVTFIPSPTEPPKRKYPYLGRYEDNLVFFTAPHKGICFAGTIWSKGKESTTWGEENFTPFYGTITIERD